jgi:ElaB/YqjD/DUF883 family membrane-anchored ribosome-binding protein
MTVASNTMTSTNPVSNIASRAHQAVDDAASKAAPAVDRAAAAAHRTIDKVADSAIPATEWAKDNGRKLVDSSNALVETCGSYVRERPLTAIAGALLIGYLAGRIMR